MTISLNKDVVVRELEKEGYTYDEVERAYYQTLSIIDWIIHNKQMNETVLHNYIKSILIDKLK